MRSPPSGSSRRSPRRRGTATPGPRRAELLDTLIEGAHAGGRRRPSVRAAERFHLSQSSMSRTLQRLRVLFGDELLVRAGSDYELTLPAREVQNELSLLLPHLENLLKGQTFDPATATGCRPRSSSRESPPHEQLTAESAVAREMTAAGDGRPRPG
ncbi:LysR family transcriptional regulator [Actinoplanes sp. NPDC051470]|uniref:helix-turn-helix domain-containing protein n=1 Tax=Actinoplanes sp. NPDC051470 TaxID=3157224 RepID=UPI003441A35B